jgi:hypothetical protein
MPASRVVVFIDYQNVYKAARRCMGLENSPSHIDGQFDPRRLGIKFESQPVVYGAIVVRVENDVP